MAPHSGVASALLRATQFVLYTFQGLDSHWRCKSSIIQSSDTSPSCFLRPQGPNLLKLARKEQCLALLTQLRTKFKLNGQFYRVFPNGEVRARMLCHLTAAAVYHRYTRRYLSWTRSS